MLQAAGDCSEVLMSDVQVLARWEEFQSKVKAYRDKVSALLPLLADSVCVCAFVCVRKGN